MEFQMTNMTISHNSQSHSGPAVLPALTVIANLLARAARRLKHRREMNQLLALPDYQLKDIGLQRSDIQRESLKSLWR
jgi:uncharacterized protein YjiS (DUF1127 family)